jgi:hypothetical protein
VTLSNASTRWFAERYDVYVAWSFGGAPRSLLTNRYVNDTLQVGAVSLL